MATPTFLTLIFLLLLSLSPTSPTPSPPPSTTLTLLHIYGKSSPYPPPTTPSWFDTLLLMSTGDTARLHSLTDSKTTIPVASGQQLLQTGNYIARAKLGTPGQLLFMVLDTGNDAAWVPCSPTLFSPNRSSTYRTTPCRSPTCSLISNPTCSPRANICLFNQSYGGDSSSSIAGVLSTDTLRLSLDVIPGYGFGCVKAVSGTAFPPQGILGLGRGPLSLISQTRNLYHSVFSYCLPSFRSASFTGSLRLGPTIPTPNQPAKMKTTPLLSNPHRPSLYYVNLTGISIRKHLVNISPELLRFNPVTGGGTIIDSGTVITRFVTPVYLAIRDEFRKRIKGEISSLGAFDTCFVTPQNVPLITLHFTGMDLTLPMENSVIHRSSGPIACLAMAAAPDNLNSVVNVIANLQQQNLRVVYDVGNSRLGIYKEICK